MCITSILNIPCPPNMCFLEVVQCLLEFILHSLFSNEEVLRTAYRFFSVLKKTKNKFRISTSLSLLLQEVWFRDSALLLPNSKFR